VRQNGATAIHGSRQLFVLPHLSRKKMRWATKKIRKNRIDPIRNLLLGSRGKPDNEYIVNWVLTFRRPEMQKRRVLDVQSHAFSVLADFSGDRVAGMGSSRDGLSNSPVLQTGG
jgi:hypothetical protein